MVAKVYDPPEGLDAPEFGDFQTDGRYDTDGYFKAVEEHREKLAQWCRDNASSPSDLIGKTIRFQVADGYAQYMVCSTRPLELLHLDYVDGYEADPILLRGLTLTDVKDLVGRAERLAEIFGGRS